MSQEFSASEGVKELVNEIIIENNFDPCSKVGYQLASQIGDGYTSDTIAINVEHNDRALNLFVKCSKGVLARDQLQSIFQVEAFFYDTLYPAFVNFQRKHNVKDIFENVPTLYGVSMKGSQEIIALENLKTKGYQLFNPQKFYNDEHLTLILRTFAKFHAISYAFKDQEKETYESWRGNLTDYAAMLKTWNFDQMIGALVKDFFSKLDQTADEDILLAFADLPETCNSHFKTLLMDYAIITKGDCWNNNMMFLYENGDNKNPIDIMLVDWQIMKECSPVHDLVAFVHQMATLEMLDNMDHYLKVYHDELSLRIRELGSDPNVLYPYSAFLKEWDRIIPIAFTFAIMGVKIILTEKDEVLDVNDILGENDKKLADLYPVFKNEDAYLDRVKNIGRHLIKRMKMNPLNTV